VERRRSLIDMIQHKWKYSRKETLRNTEKNAEKSKETSEKRLASQSESKSFHLKQEPQNRLKLLKPQPSISGKPKDKR
jgi:hypothetical protein